jgi:hypothetical protein
MMAVHDVGLHSYQLFAQRTNEGDLVSQWHWRVDNTGSGCKRGIVERTWPTESAIECPICLPAAPHGVFQRSHEPVLDCAAIERLYNMEDRSNSVPCHDLVAST